MSEITAVIAREILDSRGNPTVEVEVQTESGSGRAAVPSGASTGEHEAIELRDGDKKRYRRQGRHEGRRERRTRRSARRSSASTRSIRPRSTSVLLEADGTPNKSKLGANAILGVSMAVARAAADAVGLPLWRYLGGANARVLPTPLMNILNGGAHADNGLEIQEFMIVPLGAADLRRSAPRRRRDLPRAQEEPQGQDGLTTAVGDEGGFAPRLGSNEEAIALVIRAIEDAGYKPGKDVVARARLRRERVLRQEDAASTPSTRSRVTRDELVGDLREAQRRQYPIISIEDGFAEDDWDAWKLLTDKHRQEACSSSATISSSPTSSASRAASREGIANAILIKLNQIGTLTETLDTIRDGDRGRLPLDHQPPLGRDRGHVHRRPRGRDQRRADQDRQPFALAIASPSTTSSSASAFELGEGRSTRAKGPSRARR